METSPFGLMLALLLKEKVKRFTLGSLTNGLYVALKHQHSSFLSR